MQKENTKNTKGVAAAFKDAITNLPNKLNKIWQSEKGRGFIIHLIISFLPTTKKEVFRIGNFSNHKKHNNIPKVCSLTGFAVSDSEFKIDEVTIEHFKKINKKINRLILPIPCVGSTKSNIILSHEALFVFRDWVSKNEDAELKLILNNEVNKKFVGEKKPIGELKTRATYSIGDKYNLTKLKK